MVSFINVADLKDASGRTYREINNAKRHAYSIGDLVELETGVRLFIIKLTRDCDGTPLYTLTPEIRDKDDAMKEHCWIYGYSEESVKATKE